MTKDKYLKIKSKLNFKISNNIFYINFFFDIAVLLGIMFLSNSFAWLTSILLPILIFRAFAYMHEAVHSTLHTNRNLNTVFGVLTGAICFLPFEQWKRIHIEHHLWAGNTEQDPTLLIVKNYPKMNNSQKDKINFYWKSWLPVLAFFQHLVFWYQSNKKLVLYNFNLKMSVSAVAPIIFWSGFFAVNYEKTVYIIIGFVSYLFLVEFINWPHHLGKFKNLDKPLPRWEQASITRTCRYPIFFERLIILNFNFHTEHHIFPELPWHQLNQLHSEILNVETILECDYNSKWLFQARSQNIAEVFKVEQEHEQHLTAI